MFMKVFSSWHTNITDLEGLPETNFWIPSWDKLLSEIPFIAGRRNRLYNWPILQFLSLVEFVTTRISCRVIVAEIGMMFADGSYDITFHDLHVVDIVEQLHC